MPKYLQKLLTAGEENLPALIRKLKGQPALEGEVVGDLATVAKKKVLPDIEGELASQKLLTAPIEQTIAQNADEAIGKFTPQKQSLMDTIGSLSPQQKAIGAAGLVTAASAPLFMGGESDEYNEIAPLSKTPEKAKQTESPKIAKPEQSVAKSQSTGKASVVDNALQSHANEIQSSSNQEDTFNQRLEEARQKDAEQGLLFGLLRAAQSGGAALAGSKADTSFADTQLEKGNQFVNQLKTDMELKQEHQKISDEAQLRDPNSPLFRLVSDQYTKAFGKPLPVGVTPLQLKAMGMDIDALSNAVMRKESHAMDMELKKQQLAATKELKMDQAKQKDANAYATWLAGQTKGRSGIVQNALTQVQRGESLNEMFNALPKKSDGNIDFGTATKAHKEELIKAIDLMLSGGKSTISGSEHLRQAYGTAFDQLAGIRQKIAGDNLPSLGEQNIVHQLYDLMKRETDVARLQAARNLEAGGSKAFHSLTPDEKRQQIQQITGISPEEQALMNEAKVGMPLMVQLRSKGLNPSEVLSALKSGQKIENIIKGTAPESTTIDKGIVPAGIVTIRSKKTGTVKTLPADKASKYLNDPNFERVQ